MKYTRIWGLWACLCAILCTMAPAFAHSGPDGAEGGFAAGIAHPVLGLDHLLAMVSVGILSAQIGGRYIWIVPSIFVLVMAVGGVWGIYEWPMVWTEYGIAASVIVLGLAIACGPRIKPPFAMVAVAVFAVFHGYAHGLEIPDVTMSGGYIAGFMLGTAFLHLCGVAIGETARRLRHGPEFLRYAGAVVAGIGLHIFFDVAYWFKE